jgi:hypothetical protein
MNDLITLLTFSATGPGCDLLRIARTLLDVLPAVLHIDFVYVRLIDPNGGQPLELARVAQSIDQTMQPQEIGQALDQLLGDAASNWPTHTRMRIGAAELFAAPARLGLQGEIGVIIAGSHSSLFPTQTDRLLLNVATNQITIALQEARLLSEQKSLARELDERIVQRMSELAAANETSAQEVEERQRTEEVVRESEQYLRLIADSIPGLIATLTPRGKVEFVNRQILDYFGRTLEELKDWETSDTIHSEDLPRVVQLFSQSVVSGDPFVFEARARRSDGVYRWFQFRGLPLQDPRGDIVRWYNLLIDIDERRRAEEALAASGRKLKLIIDTIPILAWSARPDGSAEFFNQHFLDYVGFSAELAQDWGWTVALHPDDLNGLVGTWQVILALGKPGETEARLRRFDGVYRWFLFRTNPLCDESGNILNWYGTNTDINDRKRAEEELRRSEAFLAEGQRLSRTGSFSWRSDPDEITFSDELYRIFEFEKDLPITLEQIGARVHPEDLPLLAEKIQRARAGTDDHDYEIRLQMPHGRVKYLRTAMRGARYRDGRQECLGSVQDITEHRLSEEALGRLRSELARVSRVTSLGAMTASIAHEVNQPLAGIITNASTCLRMLAADPPNVHGARETARRTIRDGNRAADVITRLRALFSKKAITFEPVDLNEAAREVIALSWVDLQRSRVVLRTEFANELPLVGGDRVQLQQVIMNLLRNAADAMSGVDDRPRQLVIRTETDEDDHVQITVQDAGVGFSSQGTEQLFEAFYTTKSNGMGIGLSVSRFIIENHGGRLWAAPNDGPGASFSLSIPKYSRDEALVKDVDTARTNVTNSAHGEVGSA